jgi:putative PIN family toxin of toxin-antitoxin system
MRVVIDTNIWISGLLWRGLPWQLLRLAEDGAVELCMTLAMRDELADVLGRPRWRSRLRVLNATPLELVDYAVALAQMHIDSGAELPPIVTDDPDDDIFFNCAVSAGARYVISGDRHLLSLGAYRDIPVVEVRDFLMREFPGQLAD